MSDVSLGDAIQATLDAFIDYGEGVAEEVAIAYDTTLDVVMSITPSEPVPYAEAPSEG